MYNNLISKGTPSKDNTMQDLGTRLKDIKNKDTKMYSHQMPLNLNYKRGVKLDENKRKSILKNHEAKS